MVFKSIIGWFKNIFGSRKRVRLGFYGPPNAGKTTLANKIAVDWTGKPIGKVSEIPHETRVVQKKEKIVIRYGKKMLEMDLLDMPGIATKVDYKEFVTYGLSEEEARKRAKEATMGIIEAIKYLENVDVSLVVIDATEDPYTQVNITILGNLESRGIPIIVVANKMDISNANPRRIREAFPQYPLIEISAKTDKDLSKLYEMILKHAK